jgi:hypothetical protein
VKKDANIDKILEILNSFDPDIVFTHEEEKYNSIPFLDIRIVRIPTSNSSNSIKLFTTSIYRKSTYTGLLIKWDSFVPRSYKTSAISSMVYRAIKICSTHRLMHTEFKFVKKISKANGYPIGFVYSQIRKTLGRYYDKINKTNDFTPSNTTKSKTNNQGVQKEQVFVDIPFYGKLTDKLGKRLINIAKSANPLIHIQPIHRPPPSISKQFTLKDPIPKSLQSNIVYKIDCSNCEASYIGKTIRQATRRFKEHGAEITKKIITQPQVPTIISNTDNLRRSERNKGKKVQYFTEEVEPELVPDQHKEIKSALHQHVNETNHKIDWKNFKIITKDIKHYRLLVRESLAITHHQPLLNKTVCSVPLVIYPEGLHLKRPKVKMKQ